MKVLLINFFLLFNQNLPISENLGAAQGAKDESDVLIECRNVHKSFGDKQILKGVSFKVNVLFMSFIWLYDSKFLITSAVTTNK